MKIYDAVRQLLNADGLEFDEAGPILRLAYGGTNGRFLLVIRIHEQRHQVACFALSPIDAGPRLQEASELVQRLNEELTTVAFDIQLDNGTIRCRGGIDIEGAEASQSTTKALVSNLLYAVAAAMDEALPAITAVVVSGLEPLRALKA